MHNIICTVGLIQECLLLLNSSNELTLLDQVTCESVDSRMLGNHVFIIKECSLGHQKLNFFLDIVRF